MAWTGVKKEMFDKNLAGAEDFREAISDAYIVGNEYLREIEASGNRDTPFYRRQERRVKQLDKLENEVLMDGWVNTE